MFDRLRTFWQGRVFFIARGEQLPHFLNYVLQEGVALYHTQRSERGMRAQVRLDDFRRLKRAARRTHTRVHIIAKYGWPFVAARWWRRKGLIAGIAVIAVGLTVLSQLVLVISVTGNRTVETSEIIQRAEKLGLRTWTYSKGLDLNKIAKTLQEELPDAAWVGLERNGTEIVIKISEKIRPSIPKEAGNLVASHAGLVKEIMVIQGVPQVHEGELVRAGQVLIAKAPTLGVPTTPIVSKAEPNPAKSTTPDLPASAAKGFVRGRVWYSAEQQMPLVEDKNQESGRVAKGWGIKFGSRVIMVTMQNSPFEQAHREVLSHSIRVWRNWRFPVEVIQVNYKELQNVHIQRSVSEARQLAEETARSEVMKKISPGAQIIEETVKVLPSNPGVERVRVEVETYEDLAVYANP
ncbi:putative stage IV sporulation protein YqfD [Desulfosporosinus acididurans]|uniref:Putative stage IV sporulation protein YqfD n=1 Tax=Desulfosporosinus acididurans TaxID=476652 RepID=A0A0J1FSP0_9FIRM|nr:sporulation protein YqfD [Desulfosporosinus acididurans]KLU65988.1 putative stage IV sporulation protein YqfD [Desulfosporosinus acididurans]